MSEGPDIRTETDGQDARATTGARAGTPAPLPVEAWAFKAHPLVPLPPAEELARDMADPARRPAALAFLTGRARLLQREAADPLYHKLRLPSSREVDRLLCQYQVVYESGGKRSGKTFDGVPRFLRSCFQYGRAKRWAMQDNDLSSKANLQSLVWDYLPDRIKKLNKKRKGAETSYRVHYTLDGGFDGVLILPTAKGPCEIYFLNYTQKPDDFLGWELGKSVEVPLEPEIPDIGALLDENCPLPWFENIQLRCSTRGAKIHWMYSPQDGITPTIRDLKSNAVTIKTRPAELLADKINVPGLPRGHMPFVQTDERKRLAIVYRYTEDNPFSGYAGPGGVRELCLGKNKKDYTMRHAYGYCEGVRGRAVPLFGEWNVVPSSAVPALGTNRMVTDPGGAKNWFALWGRSTRGESADKPNLYIYREWPDFDDWAVTSKLPKRLNGDVGPGQSKIGYGVPQYKNLFLRLERIVVPPGVRGLAATGEGALGVDDGASSALQEALKTVRDPHHRARILEAVKRGEDLEGLSEKMFRRLIDPRAARNQSVSDGANEDLLTKLAQRNMKGEVLEAEPMHFDPAPGLDLRDGLAAIDEYLYFDQQQERTPILNYPRLFVAECCRNLIWALNNYSLPTDETTTDDACEDPIDCLRYLVTSGATYVEPGGRVKTTGGGSY